jgi:hypothetical protein
MNQGQVEKVVTRMDSVMATNKNNREKTALQNGDPTTIQNQIKLAIGAGDLTTAKDLYSLRTNVKADYNTKAQQQAITLGLNPTHYSVEAMKAKADAFDKYSAGGKIGQNLNAFRAFTEHLDGAADANNAWTRANSPLLNKPLSWIAKNMENDPTYTQFKTALIAPAKEYMTFLNNNRAEHTEDIRALESIVDANATPAQIYTALQTFARTADDRLLALGQGYVDTVGTTFPGLMSKASIDNLKRLGVQSRAAAFTGDLPRAQSWVSNLQPQTISLSTPEGQAIAKRFKEAAGGDSSKAESMAKEHGYLLSH